MKITKQELKEIIKEEVNGLLNEIYVDPLAAYEYDPEAGMPREISPHEAPDWVKELALAAIPVGQIPRVASKLPAMVRWLSRFGRGGRTAKAARTPAAAAKAVRTPAAARSVEQSKVVRPQFGQSGQAAKTRSQTSAGETIDGTLGSNVMRPSKHGRRFGGRKDPRIHDPYDPANVQTSWDMILKDVERMTKPGSRLRLARPPAGSAGQSPPPSAPPSVGPAAGLSSLSSGRPVAGGAGLAALAAMLYPSTVVTGSDPQGGMYPQRVARRSVRTQLSESCSS